MRRIELNLNEMHGEEEIHNYLREQLELPGSYSGDVDELRDLLLELPENVCIELIRCSEQNSSLSEYGEKLERVMEDAAQTVEYREDGRMFAVFADCETLDIGGGW